MTLLHSCWFQIKTFKVKTKPEVSLSGSGNSSSPGCLPLPLMWLMSISSGTSTETSECKQSISFKHASDAMVTVSYKCTAIKITRITLTTIIIMMNLSHTCNGKLEASCLNYLLKLLFYPISFQSSQLQWWTSGAERTGNQGRFSFSSSCHKMASLVKPTWYLTTSTFNSDSNNTTQITPFAFTCLQAIPSPSNYIINRISLFSLLNLVI